jgi:hypothetical protein
MAPASKLVLMHPNTFYASLFNRPKRDEVFVIMSFAPEFEMTWAQIIEPAIREDVKLTPNRVDYNRSGESIIHDILDGIAHARLVLGDITCSLMRDMRGNVWPQRNGNVMWEIGIAHVTRVPDEVILIRADNEASIFDLTQFRAFPYDPANVPESRATVATLCKDRLRAVDQWRIDYVERYARELDFPCWMVLSQASANGYKQPTIRNMREVLSNISILPAITRLLEIGALKTQYLTITPELVKEVGDKPFEESVRYVVTPLGQAILALIADVMGILKPEVIAAFRALENDAPATPSPDKSPPP